MRKPKNTRRKEAGSQGPSFCSLIHAARGRQPSRTLKNSPSQISPNRRVFFSKASRLARKSDRVMGRRLVQSFASAAGRNRLSDELTIIQRAHERCKTRDGAPIIPSTLRSAWLRGPDVVQFDGPTFSSQVSTSTEVTGGRKRCSPTLRCRIMGMPRNPHRPKLTWEKVRQICELRASGASLSQLEARFGVSRQWVCMILKGRAWKERRDPGHQ